MEEITQFWNLFLVWPIEGALLALTQFTTSAGLAIVLFTLIVRTVMLPLGIKQARSQRAMLKLQPQVRELQKRFGNDRAKFGQEQMRLYRESGVNPLAGCLPLVLQMPIWFALYSSLINLSSREEAFQASFLWLPSLAHPALPRLDDPLTWTAVVLPLLTAASQWVVQRMSTLPSVDPQQQQMSRMMEFMPLMFLVFSFQVASGLVLYWVVSNMYSMVQQYFMMGWGTLPILGSRAGAAENSPSAVSGDEESAQTPSRPRRKASARRRRGR
ncbi:MAG: membrane protein insertase YidC [Chloroflexi bacterium]|nr:membrane protein insertase YidC [Chloroflexota bacterium]